MKLNNLIKSLTILSKYSYDRVEGVYISCYADLRVQTDLPVDQCDYITLFNMGWRYIDGEWIVDCL